MSGSACFAIPTLFKSEDSAREAEGKLRIPAEVNQIIDDVIDGLVAESFIVVSNDSWALEGRLALIVCT